jgi:cell wall-associated NlpC family hydrolase
MGRIVAVAVTGFVGLAVGLGGCVALVGGAAGGTPSTVSGAAPAGGTASTTSGAAVAGQAGGTVTTGTAGTATPAVPASWEQLDQAAAATCAGLPWAVLAAIGRVESDSGQSAAPGVASGANPAGAAGPMQFEPATFAAYATTGPGGVAPPSPYDPVDAVYTAAAMLCANGGASASGLYGAVWDYDHDATYVDTVLVLADVLGNDPALGAAPATALAFAAAQLGVPYLWGGTGVGGYDCSGLVQAAYRSAGIALPRVAQTQFDAGPVATPPVPGDLVFFGQSATDISHVGISLGDGRMIDAPYTGTVVRVDPGVPTAPGTPWGGERYIGATAPG